MNETRRIKVDAIAALEKARKRIAHAFDAGAGECDGNEMMEALSLIVYAEEQLEELPDEPDPGPSEGRAVTS